MSSPGIPADPPAPIPSIDCGNSVAGSSASNCLHKSAAKRRRGNNSVYLWAQITDTYNQIVTVWTT